MKRQWKTTARSVSLVLLWASSVLISPVDSRAASLDAMNLVSQGNGLYCARDFVGATNYYLQAINLDTTNYPAAYADLGLALAQLGDFTGAFSSLQAAINLDSSNKVYWLNLGKVQAMNEQYADAINSFSNALFFGGDYK